MEFKRHLILRYLRARRGFVRVVTLFSLLGIFLGVAALIVVMSVMSGFREELLNRILGMTGHIGVTVNDVSIDQAKYMRDMINSLDGVRAAQIFTQGQALIVTGNNASGVLVRGIDPRAKTGQELLVSNIPEGNILDLEKPGSVAIGAGLARQMRLRVGDEFTLMSPRGTPTVAGFMPRMKRVKVAAVFHVGMYIYDSNWMLMSLEEAGKFFSTPDRVGGFEIKVYNADKVNQYVPAIQEITGMDSHVNTWTTSNQQFFEALQVEKVAMFIILSLVVIVAAFNIITGQTMLVNTKRGDIAILRTMGARRKDIIQVFFYNGLILGAIGTFSGVIIGLVIAYNLHPIVSFIETVTGVSVFSGEAYYLDEIPVTVIWSDVGRVILMSLGLALLASFYPAWRASKMDPVEILRNE